MTHDFQYVWNVEPNRHIWGADNKHWFSDESGNPRKEFMIHDGTVDFTHYRAYTKKRPKEELFDLKNDPHCLKNIADDPTYLNTKILLRNKLMQKLKEDSDPRVLDQGSWFDMAPFPPDMMKFAQTEGCMPFSSDYTSPFSRDHLSDDIKQRKWDATSN